MDSLNATENAFDHEVDCKEQGTAAAVPKSRQLKYERLLEVLNYGPATGVFTWRTTRPGCVAGRSAGTIADGYRQIEIDYKLFRASRLAWLYMTGEWPQHMVDHINGNRSDDRWTNLREATPAQNARNRGKCRRNTSGKVGVHPIKATGKWGAEIGVNGRNVRLGQFGSLADAISARSRAEKLLYGKFARGACQ